MTSGGAPNAATARQPYEPTIKTNQGSAKASAIKRARSPFNKTGFSCLLNHQKRIVDRCDAEAVDARR